MSELYDDEIVEMVAKALWNSPAFGPPTCTWDELSDDARELWRADARAVRAAILGEEVSQGADGASVRSLGDRLRAAADYQDRPGAYDELRSMADEADRLQPIAQVIHTVRTRGGVGDVAGVRIERVQDGTTATERRLEEARAQVNGLIQEKDQWHDSAKVAEAAVERVRGLAAEWASSPAVGGSSSEQWEFDTLRAAAHDLHEALDGGKEAGR